MASQKHETVLSYKADARGLKDLARELKRTFDPSSAKEMNRAYKDMGSALKGLTAEQARLNAELLKTRDGSKAYKTLEKALDSVEKKAKRLKNTLKAMRPDPGGFSQGLAQGFFPGVAGFIQRGPGQRAQMAGQFAGAAARMPFRAARAGGMAVGNAATGGGVASLLQGVPFLGGLASMAQGAVGAATSQEQAMLLGLMASGGMAGVGSARSRGISRAQKGAAGRISERALALQTAKSEKLFATLPQETAAAAQTLSGIATNRNGKGGVYNAGIALGRAERGLRGPSATADFNDQAEGIARRGIQKVLNREAAKSLEQAARGEASKQAAAGRAGAAKAMRNPFSGAITAGARMGMDDTASIQLATQMARQIGGGIPGGAGMETIFGAQLQGVETGTSARLMRQMRGGRGGTGGNAANQIAGAIGDAVALKLEGSEVNEYLATIAAAQERAEQQGLKISSEGFGGLARAMSAAGAVGPRAGAIAGQFASGAARTGLQGVSDPISAGLFRAAGFDPAKGGLSYLRAGKKLQKLTSGKADPGMLFDFAKNMIGGIAGGNEFGDLQRERTLQQTFARLGVNIGPDEAESLAKSVGAGRESFLGAVKGTELERKLIGGKAATGGNLKAGARGADLAAATTLARQQAAVANKLVESGKNVATLVNALNLNAADMSKSVGDLVKPANEFIPLLRQTTNLLGTLASFLGNEGQSLAQKTVGG